MQLKYIGHNEMKTPTLGHLTPGDEYNVVGELAEQFLKMPCWEKVEVKKEIKKVEAKQNKTQEVI